MCYDTRVQKPSLRLSIQSTLAYSSIFEYPLSVPELYSRLIGKFPQISLSQFSKEVSATLGIEKSKDWLYLSAYLDHIKTRQKRQYFSTIKKREAQTILSVLENIPTITSAYITGSLAMDNVSSMADDIDILIVTVPGTLWLTRLIVVLWTSLIGKYRLHDTNGEWGWCFNLWLDQNHLQMQESSRSVYSAYEVIQAKQLLGTQNELLAHNQWVNEYINYSENGKTTKHYETRRKEIGEVISYQLLGIRIFAPIVWVLEKLSYLLQRLYMQPKKTKERVGAGFAFFHPRETKKLIMKKWQERLREMGISKKEIEDLARFFEEGERSSS